MKNNDENNKPKKKFELNFFGIFKISYTPMNLFLCSRIKSRVKKLLSLKFALLFVSPIIFLFFFFKIYSIYLIRDFSSKANDILVRVENIQEKCLQNKNFNKTNEVYFSYQQETIFKATDKFVTSDTYQDIWKVFGSEVDDMAEKMSVNMLQQSAAPCSVIDSKLLRKQMNELHNKMWREFFWL